MSTLTFKIAGTTYPVIIDSFSLKDQIEQASECSFSVKDVNDVFAFQKGQTVLVNDSVEGDLFAGIVHTSTRDKEGTTGSYVTHNIECVDLHWIPESRSSNKQYGNEYTGPILIDQIRDLVYSGIAANYAMDKDETIGDWSAGQLANTVATSNNGGDLELALAGVPVNFVVSPANSPSNVFSHNGTQQGSFITCNQMSAIQFTASCTVPGSSSNYLYVSIMRNVAYTIVSGDQITFDVWISKSSKKIMASVDFTCTDGTAFRDNTVTFDQQWMGPHPATDLTGLADNQWYSRTFNLYVAGLSGKTIDFISIAIQGSDTGDYAAYFRRIKIVNGGTTKVDVFNDSSTATPNIPQAVYRASYTNESITVIQAYDSTCTIVTTAQDMTPAGIYQSSAVSWDIVVPTDCSVAVTGTIDASAVGNGAVHELMAANGPLQGLIPGMNLTSLQTYFHIYLFNNSNAPTISPQFYSLGLTINPSYVASKNDIRNKTKLTADYSAGTLTNLIANNNILYITGYQHKLDFGLPSVTIYGNSGPAYQQVNRSLRLNAANGTDAKLLVNDAGNWQNFTASVDVQLSAANLTAGLFFRTSNYGTGNNNYAYVVYISTTTFSIVYGANSASSSAGIGGSVSSVPVTLSTNQWYTLTIQANGTTFDAWLNGVHYISAASDSRWNISGGIGLHSYNNSGGSNPVYFRNFGVVAALSGTYVTPAIDIHTAGSVLAAFTRTQAAGDLAQATLKTEISLNNGSTWADCSGTQAATQSSSAFIYDAETIPGLAPGTNISALTQVKLRLTLSISSAAAHLETQGTIFYVISAYSSTGTRISPALLLSAVGRVGSTLAAYNAIQPNGTSVVMATSPDGTSWTNVASGSPIPGITQQPAPTIDNFDLLSAGSYTSTARTGGSAVSWPWDTANSRLSVSGGNNSLLLYGAVSCKDVDAIADIDQADCAGLVWRWQDPSNFYELDVFDASSSAGSTNVLRLYKVVSNAKTQIGSTVAITLARGIKGRIRVLMIGPAITVYFDGTSVLTASDSALAGPGQVGLICVSGIARFCNLRIQPLGDDLTGKKVYSRFALTTTDPLQTPQVVLSTVLATSPNIGVGSLIDSADYRQKYRSDNINDLADRSGYIWTVLVGGALLFNQRQTLPSPWCLQDRDVLVQGITVAHEGDLYRNRQTLTGVLADDGSTTYVTRDNLGQFPGTISQSDYINQSGISIPTPIVLNLASAAYTISGDSGDLDVSLIKSIALDINITAVGGSSPTLTFFVDRKGADGLYYQIWSSGSLTSAQQVSRSIGPGCTVNQSLGTLARVRWVITGSSPSWTFSVSILGTLDIEGAGIGVVEAIEDVSKLNLSIAAALDYADSRLKDYGVYGRTVNFGTTRTGLQAGMALSATITKHKMTDVFVLVTSVQRTTTVRADGSPRYWFSIQAVEGPALADWRKAMNQTVKGG